MFIKIKDRIINTNKIICVYKINYDEFIPHTYTCVLKLDEGSCEVDFDSKNERDSYYESLYWKITGV